MMFNREIIESSLTVLSTADKCLSAVEHITEHSPEGITSTHYVDSNSLFCRTKSLKQTNSITSDKEKQQILTIKNLEQMN